MAESLRKQHLRNRIVQSMESVFGCKRLLWRRISRDYYNICLYVLFVALAVHTASCVSVDCGDNDCINGHCRNISGSVSCVCDQGWAGLTCQHCSGRQKLNGTSGFITDGQSNYTLDNKCTWLIESPNGQPIRLRFQYFATECSWDHLYIYDGTSVWNSTTLAILSGLVTPMPRTNQTIPEITAESGYAYIHFYSDVAYTMHGFNITYVTGSCPLDCSGHGSCDDYTCSCDEGWMGEGCDTQRCPHDCHSTDGHGTCTDGPDSFCNCNEHWRGIDCSIPSSKGSWSEVSRIPSDNIPDERASHASVLHRDNNNQEMLWMIYGYDFGKSDFQDIVKIYLAQKIWTTITPKSDVSPRRRYGHAAALHEGKIYMYGGLIGKEITNELWMFDVDLHTWELVTDVVMSDKSLRNERLAVVGHSAHIIEDTFYIFFGYSPIYGFCKYVQKYHIPSGTWTVEYGGGAIVEGGYGHSSVYHAASQNVYIHAGYYRTGTNKFSLTDDLYSFHVPTESWFILRNSGQFKYLHSAVILNNLMLVFGGNIHNDTAHSQGAKCYSTDFMVYDIDCDEWFILDPPKLNRNIARFGHTANVFEDKLFVFGGFNGLIHNDMYEFVPGICESIDNKHNCLSWREGIKCAWINNNACMEADKAADSLRNKYLEKATNATCSSHPEDDGDRCADFSTCPSCVDNVYNCVWCASKCSSVASKNCDNRLKASSSQQCLANFSSDSKSCSGLHTCHACYYDDNCIWSSTNQCQPVPEDATIERKKSIEEMCDPPCQDHMSCENCTSAQCMWCVSEERCVDSSSYVPSFPYGQCMEWTMIKDKCPVTRCEGLRTCGACLKNPQCGWCDDGSNTGLGTCMEGTLDKPRQSDTCAADTWYFTSCPLCQCNGHSHCLPNTSICEKCQDLTTGPQCQYCTDGFWGDPTGGANCSACSCNGNADLCNQSTGNCYCHTNGMIGPSCEKCDNSKSCFGDPMSGGTCYFNLSINFKYDYNLSPDKNQRYHTKVNFMNTPPNSNVDVDFRINCTGSARFNVSVLEGGEEKFYLTNRVCQQHSHKFSHKDFHIGIGTNTTFYVYVYDFKTPFGLQLSFSQFAHINLVQFFVTFFSCFLSLLLIAAVFWKIKQKYDLYRRRQRLVVEMEQMASRPFSCVHMEIEDRAPPPITLPPPPPQALQSSELRASSRRRNKPTTGASGPSPVALEPLVSQKAAVLSLIFRLPCGDEDYAPPGQPGIAVGSTLVSLGNARKSSTDHSRIERGGKGRKSKAPENCV